MRDQVTRLRLHHFDFTVWNRWKLKGEKKRAKKQNITKKIIEYLGIGWNKVFESQEFENKDIDKDDSLIDSHFTFKLAFQRYYS